MGRHKLLILLEYNVSGKERKQNITKKKNYTCGFKDGSNPKCFAKSSRWKTSEAAKERQFEKFLPIKLYCVIPTKQRQKDKSQLPTFIYN